MLIEYQLKKSGSSTSSAWIRPSTAKFTWPGMGGKSICNPSRLLFSLSTHASLCVCPAPQAFSFAGLPLVLLLFSAALESTYAAAASAWPFHAVNSRDVFVRRIRCAVRRFTAFSSSGSLLSDRRNSLIKYAFISLKKYTSHQAYSSIVLESGRTLHAALFSSNHALPFAFTLASANHSSL